MGRLHILLRMLVFVAALLLLLSYPRGPRAQGVRAEAGRFSLGTQEFFLSERGVGENSVFLDFRP